MPYIKQENRDRLKDANAQINNAGELNYLIHLEIEKELDKIGHSYESYNNIIGALEILKTGDYETDHDGSFIRRIAMLLTKFNYMEDKFVQTMGALTCIQMELYRRLISNYEDQKKDLNGDIQLYV